MSWGWNKLCIWSSLKRCPMWIFLLLVLIPVINYDCVYNSFEWVLWIFLVNDLNWGGVGNPPNLHLVSDMSEFWETVPWDFAVWLTVVMTPPYSPPFSEFETWPESQIYIVVVWEKQGWPLLLFWFIFPPTQSVLDLFLQPFSASVFLFHNVHYLILSLAQLYTW